VTDHPLLYDPDCGFCRVCVAVVLSWDRRGLLRPVSLTSTEGNELLAGMPEAERMASWHLANSGWSVSGAENAAHTDHPVVWSAGAAFSPLFRLLPGGAPLALLTDRFPGAAERAYRWVAGHRSAIGRLIPQAARTWADRVISDSARGRR
jgi:predicted DCC family thiol-disulfide oxidoreductase YuxK